MAASRWIALLLFVLMARAAGAATIGVAWDPSPESAVTGYRVFVGRIAGVPSESFDVGLYQTSFMYRLALPGQRYYFSVAAIAGGMVGRPSPEISGVAGSPPDDVRPQTPFDAGIWTSSSASAPGLAAPMRAGTFGEISQLVTSEAGIGMFIESGVRVRLLSRVGVAPDAALEAGPAERFVALALDPGFAVNGLAYVVSEVTSPGSPPQRVVTRHRLAGSRLGEAAVVLAGLPVSAAPAITVSAAGDLFITAGAQVLRVAADGTVPRGQPAGRPEWAAIDGRVVALLWDDARGGLWAVTDRDGIVAARFFPDGPSGRATRETTITHDRASHVGLNPSPDGAYASVVSGRDVTRVDLERGTATVATVPVPDGALVGWAPGWAGDYIVLDDRTSGPATAVQRLMLVAATAKR